MMGLNTTWSVITYNQLINSDGRSYYMKHIHLQESPTRDAFKSLHDVINYFREKVKQPSDFVEYNEAFYTKDFQVQGLRVS